MATVKDQLQAAKQTLYEEISEAIERYQTETGVTIVRVAYVHSDYAKPPKTHFIGFSMKTDLD